MKFLKSISLFFCMIGCLGGGIWLGAWGQRTFYPGSSEIRIEGTVHQSQQTESGKTVEKTEPLVTVAAMPERITADTVYLVKEFDLKQNTCKDSICSIPVSYIGMNREQFLKEMNSFMASPPFAELEKGFASLEVSEFSTARVTVTKYYREHEEDCFWLQVENNFVVVFLEDRKTRYEITDIYLPYLPEDLQQEIIQGKKMEGKEVLYNFLESYSS